MTESIRLEILRFSYAEHFKAAKEIALILPPEHPKMKLLYKNADKILEEIKLEQNKRLK